MNNAATKPDPLPCLTPRLLGCAYGLAATATVGGSLAWAVWSYPPPFVSGLLLGWLAAAANAAVALAIVRLGLGGSQTRFLVWALCINFLRAAVLATIIVCAHETEMAMFAPFQMATWTGYFCCLAAEITVLHVGSAGGAVGSS